MKINRRIYENMVDEIYDSLLGKEGEYIIYVSRAMYIFMKLNSSFKDYVPNLLGYPVVVKNELYGKEYEAVKLEVTDES